MNAESKITSGGAERIHDTSKMYQDAFKDDPAFIYMLQQMTDTKRHAYLYSYFTRLLKAAELNQAIFEECDDFSSATVIMPPGTRLDNPLTLVAAGLPSFLWELGLKSCYRMLIDFPSKADAAKERGLKGQKRSWLATALLKSVQARAANESIPVWLEATTEKSMRVYAKAGFEVLETLNFGKGNTGADGRSQAGGPGVTLWSMIWWPPQKDSTS